MTTKTKVNDSNESMLNKEKESEPKSKKDKK